MIKPSFIPPEDIRQLRDFVCYRKKLLYQRTSEKNRTLNCLTVSNIKLDDVFSDVFGKSSRSIIMSAITIISEIGVNMSVFPTAKNLVAWAGCCPRNDKSSKTIKSTHISLAGTHLKPLLVQIANGLVRSDKYPEIKTRYRRIKARRGHGKAIMAICKMLLTAMWHILSKNVPYSSAGYIVDKRPEGPAVITKEQGLALLRMRGFIFKEDIDPNTGEILTPSA